MDRKTYMQRYYEIIKANPALYEKRKERARRSFQKLKEDPERYAHHKEAARKWTIENKELIAARKRLRYQEDPVFREKVKAASRAYKARLRGEKNEQRTDEVSAELTADKP